MVEQHIHVSARGCSASEEEALAQWSARFLPQCQMWAARRELRPAADVLDMLAAARLAPMPLASDPATLDALRPLLVGSPSGDRLERSDDATPDPALGELRETLENDLMRYQAALAQSDAQGTPAQFSEARDIRRFYRAHERLPLSQIELAACTPLIATAFSPQRRTLYIPWWLVRSTPRILFAPNASFFRARSASVLWLLLDAIVVSSSGDFSSL